MAKNRLTAITSQLTPNNTLGERAKELTEKLSDDVVVTLALRTPLMKAKKGAFKDESLDFLVFQLLQKVLERSNIDPALIEDVCLGNVGNGQAAYIARAAALAAGIPHTSGASSVNRFCASGLKAVQDIANQIKEGTIQVGLAIGAEFMTRDAVNGGPKAYHKSIARNPASVDCLQPMGQTSENVGHDFQISRERQDQYAVESYRRAEIAQKAGWFEEEIAPIQVTRRDTRTGDEQEVTIDRDEGPRYGTSLEDLRRLRPAFSQFGNKTTAGNASQVTDGAAAVLLMRRSKAVELNQPILAKFCGATVAGVPPRIMGIAPSYAISKALRHFNLSIHDIDIFEINEAFASMAVHCLEVLGLDHAKVNPRGGAIALGHPLGATGIRQICTGLSEARRTKKRFLFTSMCAATGQGMASLIINEQL